MNPLAAAPRNVPAEGATVSPVPLASEDAATVRSGRPPVLLLAAIVLLAAIKLWCVRYDELAVRDDPFDDPWYLTSAANWYWGMPYEDGALQRQPAYPLWIAAARATGLPLRLATEVLFLSAAAAFALALRRAGATALLASAAFLAIAFHPFAFRINQFVLVDSLYAPALLLALSACVLLLRRPRPGAAVLAGAGFVVLWHTRQENLLIVAYLLLLGALLLWTSASRGAGFRTRATRTMPALLIVAGVVVAGALATRLANLAAFGSFTDYEVGGAAFQDAYRALLRIDREPALPSIPAPRVVRERAYSVSPTFRRLRPYLEGPPGRRWTAPTARAEDPAIRGEIPAGVFGWALSDAVRETGHGDSPREANAFYRGMAREIDAACNDGRLPCRPAPLGPFDPRVSAYVARVPGSALTLLRTFVWTGSPPAPAAPGPMRPDYLAFADAVTNRRARLVTAHLTLGGWAASGHDDPVQAVFFEDARGIVGVTERLRPRRDLDRYFARRGWGPATAPVNAAFELDVSVPRDLLSGSRLGFRLRSGKTFTLPYAQLRRLQLGSLRRGAAGPSVLEYAIERREGLERPPKVQDSVKAAIHRTYGGVIAVLLVLALVALPVRVLLRRQPTDPVADAVALLLLGVTALRVGLLAIVDASAWSTLDNRFLFPVAYLVPCAALLVLLATVRSARTAWNGRNAVA